MGVILLLKDASPTVFHCSRVFQEPHNCEASSPASLSIVGEEGGSGRQRRCQIQLRTCTIRVTNFTPCHCAKEHHQTNTFSLSPISQDGTCYLGLNPKIITSCSAWPYMNSVEALKKTDNFDRKLLYDLYNFHFPPYWTFFAQKNKSFLLAGLREESALSHFWQNRFTFTLQNNGPTHIKHL